MTIAPARKGRPVKGPGQSTPGGSGKGQSNLTGLSKNRRRSQEKHTGGNKLWLGHIKTLKTPMFTKSKKKFGRTMPKHSHPGEGWGKNDKQHNWLQILKGLWGEWGGKNRNRKHTYA